MKNVNLIRFGLSVFIAVMFLGCSGKTGTHPGNITYLLDSSIGDVKVSHNNGKVWDKAKVGTTLRENDKVKTDRDSSCDVIMPGRGVFRVSESTELLLKDLGRKTQSLSIPKGKVTINITHKLSGNEKFQVETTAAVVAVRGTEFQVETDGQKTKTVVKRGQVAVKRNIDINLPKDMKGQNADQYLEVPVAQNESIELDANENSKEQSRLNEQLNQASSAEQKKEILINHQKEAKKDIRKVTDKKQLEEFKDIEKSEKTEKSDKSLEDLKKELERDKAALQENVNLIKEKVGQIGIVKKVGEEVTTIKDDIKSGIADKRAEEVKKNLSDKKKNGNEKTSGNKESLKERIQKKKESLN